MSTERILVENPEEIVLFSATFGKRATVSSRCYRNRF
jgi:hypothetical protein